MKELESEVLKIEESESEFIKSRSRNFVYRLHSPGYRECNGEKYGNVNYYLPI
jgi:hypothetical protein